MRRELANFFQCVLKRIRKRTKGTKRIKGIKGIEGTKKEVKKKSMH